MLNTIDLEITTKQNTLNTNYIENDPFKYRKKFSGGVK